MIQWHTQDFRMGGVEVPQVPRGVGMGSGGCVSPSALFFVVFVENTIF